MGKKLSPKRGERVFVLTIVKGRLNASKLDGKAARRFRKRNVPTY